MDHHPVAAGEILAGLSPAKQVDVVKRIAGIDLHCGESCLRMFARVEDDHREDACIPHRIR